MLMIMVIRTRGRQNGFPIDYETVRQVDNPGCGGKMGVKHKPRVKPGHAGRSITQQPEKFKKAT